MPPQVTATMFALQWQEYYGKWLQLSLTFPQSGPWTNWSGTAIPLHGPELGEQQLSWRADPGWVLTPVLFHSLKHKNKNLVLSLDELVTQPLLNKKERRYSFYCGEMAFLDKRLVYIYNSLLAKDIEGLRIKISNNKVITLEGLVPCYSQVHKWGDNHVVQKFDSPNSLSKIYLCGSPSPTFQL